MNRYVMSLVFGVLTCALVCVPVIADPPQKLTDEERKELESKRKEFNTAGIKAYQNGQYPAATEAFKAALDAARQLYPKTDFPDGHPNLATGLNNLALLYQTQGKLTDAEKLFKEALEINKRLFKSDHPAVANSLNSLAALYQIQGKPTDAEPLMKDALEMYKRLFKDKDRPEVVTSLNNLALLYQSQGKLTDAEALLKEALEMTKRLFKGDHPTVANGLISLGFLYQTQGKLADAETLLKDALRMYTQLFRDKDHPAVARSLNNLAGLYQDQGKLTDAEPLFKDALEMTKRLFKDKDHPDVARGLHNLGALYQRQGKLADAEPLMKDALEMYKRLFKDKDHPDVALSLNNLGRLYDAQGKLTEAEKFYNDALAMYKRLFKDKDHPSVALSLNNLALLYKDQRKAAAAELLLKDALAMYKRLFKNKDHPDLARGMHNLATLYQTQGQLTAAEPLLKDALAMYKRLHKGQDHPELARSTHNLGFLYYAQGQLADAELLLKDALDMRRRLFKGQDHPDIALSLNNLAALYAAQGQLAAAELLLKDALAMHRRLVVDFAKRKSEGEALTLVSSQQFTLDALLSVARMRVTHTPTDNPATVYPAVWTTKGMLARVYEQRQLQSRAAATDPTLAKMLDQLADVRRRRAELLFITPTTDPGTLNQRAENLKTLDQTIADLNQKLPKLLPTVARANKLDNATVADLQAAIPGDAALVDYVRYIFFEYDNTKPAGKKQKKTLRYLAFVVTKDKVAWVDLDTAAETESAIAAWREAITGDGLRKVPPASLEKTDELGLRVRALVWGKVRKALPANIKTVYICPDQTLCKVPFSALPGDKASTVLLEDYAIATIPHAPFLLDKLWPQDPIKNPLTNALVVGGVKYDAEPTTLPPNAVALNGPLVKRGTKLGWSFLDNTVGEANGVSDTALRKKLPVARFERDEATTPSVLAALPKAKYAHLATHGFFADPSFRSVFQLSEDDYEQSWKGERIGRAANSPLVMTGLVFAGANNPKTPGRGILTGEQLIDIDLSGLELAVLSACETGLGDVAGGEGTFGLQRAFHYAGTKNVVASLWKVPDAPTAALMALFYRNLWEKNLSPMESLRQAQLEIYKNPQKIPELAKGFRGKFEEVQGMGEIEIKPSKDGKAHPLLWAAFTLSGPGK